MAMIQAKTSRTVVWSAGGIDTGLKEINSHLSVADITQLHIFKLRQ